MSTPIRLPDSLVEKAKRQAELDKRSPAGQIEHWAEIGKMLEENPELTYQMVRDILISMHEAKHNETENYQFGEGNNA
jgi:hypothetical protein